MQQWDYKAIVLTGGFMGRHKEELDRAAFERHLDELGNQGFELCWVLLEQARGMRWTPNGSIPYWT